MKRPSEILPGLLASLPPATPEPPTTPATTTPTSKATFDAFDDYEPSLHLAKLAARTFVAAILAHPWTAGYCLTMVGKSGNGKTMLAKIILEAIGRNPWGQCSAIPPTLANGALKRFTFAIYDMRKVADDMLSGNWQLAEAMIEPAIIVIDDVGADYDAKGIIAGKLDRVLRARAGKWTLLTSNLELGDIKTRMDARIASWLIRDDNRLVTFEAGDYALRKRA